MKVMIINNGNDINNIFKISLKYNDCIYSYRYCIINNIDIKLIYKNVYNNYIRTI